MVGLGKARRLNVVPTSFTDEFEASLGWSSESWCGPISDDVEDIKLAILHEVREETGFSMEPKSAIEAGEDMEAFKQIGVLKLGVIFELKTLTP